MQTDASLPSSDANQPSDDHLLEELAALTGLFSPEVLWHTEEKLDDLTEQTEPVEKAKSQPPTPGLEQLTGL